MAEFVRARSDANKEKRFIELKNATELLFHEKTYHEITLAAIAENVGWSRANLYKYITSKEEIFLEILIDKYIVFTETLLAAFPTESNYSRSTVAEVCAGIFTAHKDFLNYYNLLPIILETNVSLDNLVKFKKTFMEYTQIMTAHFSQYLQFSASDTMTLFSTVLFHATGLNGNCQNNALAKEAARIAGIPEIQIDFNKEMQTFICMCLNHYANKD